MMDQNLGYLREGCDCDEPIYLIIIVIDDKLTSNLKWKTRKYQKMTQITLSNPQKI